MNAKQTRLMMLGMIEELEPVDRTAAKDAIDELRHWLKMNGDAGALALGFLTVEKSIEDEENE